MKGNYAIYSCANDELEAKVESEICKKILKEIANDCEISDNNIYLDVKDSECNNYSKLIEEIKKGKINYVFVYSLESLCKFGNKKFSLIDQFPFGKCDIFLICESYILNEKNIHFLQTDGRYIIDKTIEDFKEEIEKG